MKVAASARVEFLAEAEADTPTAAANQAEPGRIAAPARPADGSRPEQAHGPGDQEGQPDPPGTPQGAELLRADSSSGVRSVVARLIQVSCSRSPVIATADEAAISAGPGGRRLGGEAQGSVELQPRAVDAAAQRHRDTVIGRVEEVAAEQDAERRTHRPPPAA